MRPQENEIGVVMNRGIGGCPRRNIFYIYNDATRFRFPISDFRFPISYYKYSKMSDDEEILSLTDEDTQITISNDVAAIAISRAALGCPESVDTVRHLAKRLLPLVKTSPSKHDLDNFVNYLIDEFKNEPDTFAKSLSFTNKVFEYFRRDQLDQPATYRRRVQLDEMATQDFGGSFDDDNEEVVETPVVVTTKISKAAKATESAPPTLDIIARLVEMVEAEPPAKKVKTKEEKVCRLVYIYNIYIYIC